MTTTLWEDLTETDIVREVRDMAHAASDFMYRPPRAANGLGDAQYLRFDKATNTYEPDCLFGHVFLALGVPAYEIRRFEGQTVDVILTQLFGFFEDSAEIEWALTVQQHQDGIDAKGNRIGRKAWGECIRIADELYPEVA
jgi:hypothetical protein